MTVLILYKCRGCEKVFSVPAGAHHPNAVSALRSYTDNHRLHKCDDVRVGVADLVGAREEA